MRVFSYLFFLFTSLLCAGNRYEAISTQYLSQFPEEPIAHTHDKENMPSLGAQDVRRLACELLRTHEDKHLLFGGKTITSPEVWHNLNLFASDDNDFAHTVAGSLNRTQTVSGEITLAALLTQQTTDTAVLHQRQQLLHLLATNTEVREKIRHLLDTFAKVEPHLLNLSQRNDPLYDRDITFTHYDFPVENDDSWLYKNQYLQELWKGIGELLNGFSFGALTITPLALLYRLCKDRGAQALAAELGMSQKRIYATLLTVSGMAYFLLPGVKRLFDLRINSLRYIRRRFADIICMMSTLHALHALDTALPLPALWPTTPHTPSSGLHKLMALLSDSSVQSSSYFFSRGGPTLAALPLLKKARVELFSCLQFIGLLDAHMSMAELLRTHQDTPGRFCFVDFVQSNTPHIDLSGFWHPQLNARTVVTNDVILGSPAQPKDLIITGPNAGGKSTALKAIALCIVLAQTFGVAPAKKAQMTPFHQLNTYLNITDNLAQGHSLFKAELHRANELINRIKTLPPSTFCFTIMDEILRSTNPSEGEAGAFSIARYLGEQPNSMLLLATHFPTLPTLAELPDTTFGSYKVDATINTDGSITYPYTFSPGVNLTNIALDILRNEGFAPALVHEAAALLGEKS